VRHTVLAEVGGFEASVPHGYEDQTLVAKLALTAPVLAADQVLDRYRQHPESLTAGRSQRVEAAHRVAFLRWLIGYLAEHGADRRLLTALNRQRRRYCYRAWRPLLTGGTAR
jgi:hypothetical protein